MYWRYWQQGAAQGSNPCGVVLQGQGGRVVFDWPALLPDEQFVPAEWIQGRGSSSMAGRSQRQRNSADMPWSTAQP